MPVSVLSLIAGEALPLDIEVSASGGSTAPDLDATDVTLVFDGPADADGVVPRYVFRWRPAGTSHAFFTSGGADLLLFDATSAWTANYLTTAGRWVVYVLNGPVATTQDAVGKLELAVEVPAGGALPVGDS